MLLLKCDGFEIESTGNVIKGDVYARVVEATQILDAARAEADRMAQDAQRRFEELSRQGYEEGVNKAREEMALQMFEMLDKTTEYLEHVEGQIIEIVVNSLKQILASLPPEEVIVGAVRKTLAAVMRNQRQVCLRVPAAQVENVRKQIQAILSEFPGIATVDVTADARLEGTDCILETDVGVVEAGVRQQLQILEKALQKSLRKDA